MKAVDVKTAVFSTHAISRQFNFLKSALQFSGTAGITISDEKKGERKAQLILLVVLTAACLLPFAGKAFNMDDPLFIWTAKNIQFNPLDPYGFNLNWYETEMSMSDINKNPPLVSYFLALVGSVFGWSEPALHIGILFPAMAVIAGTYLIAGRYCANPLLAGLAALFTPVFLVSGTTIMTDSMMLAFWVFAVYFWLQGLEKNSNLMLLLSVIFLSLCALTKYFGLALLPMLLLYSALRRREIGKSFIFMLLPVVTLAVYQWITGELYGRGLLADAGSYAAAFQSHFGKFSWSKLLVGLSFTGGCVLVVLFFSNLIWSRKALVIGLIIAALAAIAVCSTGSLGNYQIPGEQEKRWIIAIQFGVFIIAGISLLGLSFADFMEGRDADSTLLFVWLIGTFLFATFVNWTTAARSLLPLVPAAGILMARRVERRQRVQSRSVLRQILISLTGAAIVALAVTWADFRLANSARDAGNTIFYKYMSKKDKIWFSGHWGFQYYMQGFGARPFDMERSMPEAGDIFIVPENNANLVTLPPQLVQLRDVLDVPAGIWITTMNLKTGAGFYSDVWGPLPFAFGPAPLEQYRIFEVKSL